MKKKKEKRVDMMLFLAMGGNVGDRWDVEEEKEEEGVK